MYQFVLYMLYTTTCAPVPPITTYLPIPVPYPPTCKLLHVQGTMWYTFFTHYVSVFVVFAVLWLFFNNVLVPLTFLTSTPFVRQLHLRKTFHAKKHAVKVPNLLRTPRIDWLVEAVSVHEHSSHVTHGASVPVPQGLIEGDSFAEHSIHVADLTRLPLVYRAVE